MENLLSLAFDNLSSYDGPKVRKGLRQVEGLLAQICLSSSGGRDEAESDGYHNGDEGEDEAPASPPRKDLGQLAQDPAFREFFKLQEGFEWNVGLRLISTLDRLMAKGGDGQNDLLILSALDLLQGAMLLHPPTKGLFQPPPSCSPLGKSLTLSTFQLLLDLLEPFNCPAIQSATLLTLVVALIDVPANTRVFEALDGLLTVTSLFKARATSREVKLKLVEFLYFYLMPETPSIPRAERRDSLPDMLQRSPSKLAGAFGGGAARGGDRRALVAGTLATAEKQQLLSRYLSNVEDLVRDLRTCAPFGGVVA
ncbi:Cell division protein Cdc14 [Cordyceps fumosorosea ARSEF 2679]|uniref:Cell division protein Cdc14 n=1 Tax=Cordyceps fumosorosea (strain ARSEF 2679) TaxID=1081104 RepID=A0A167R476_CORFA|nr:Cell division protein Cdc14 [Cordyceps fumosorosea ARSEF 2679]OAA58256.1 Cell division protein Cdc14 [Cordyceps fumosorosea ARSEF 2679]